MNPNPPTRDRLGALGAIDREAAPHGRPGKVSGDGNFSSLADVRSETRAAWRKLGALDGNLDELIERPRAVERMLAAQSNDAARENLPSRGKGKVGGENFSSPWRTANTEENFAQVFSGTRTGKRAIERKAAGQEAGGRHSQLEEKFSPSRGECVRGGNFPPPMELEKLERPKANERIRQHGGTAPGRTANTQENFSQVFNGARTGKTAALVGGAI